MESRRKNDMLRQATDEHKTRLFEVFHRRPMIIRRANDDRFRMWNGMVYETVNVDEINLEPIELELEPVETELFPYLPEAAECRW